MAAVAEVEEEVEEEEEEVEDDEVKDDEEGIAVL